MTSDPFNFGPSPDNGPGWQPGVPSRGPFGDGGNPFGGPPQQDPGSPGRSEPTQHPSRHNPLAPNPLASSSSVHPPASQNPLGAPEQPAGGGGVFGAPAIPGTLTAAKPPVWLLFVAAGLALMAGVVALLLDAPAVAVACWVLAGPVAIGLLALFVVKDTFARSSGLYAAPGWVKPLHYAAIGVCLVCILAPALRIADWVGHL